MGSSGQRLLHLVNPLWRAAQAIETPRRGRVRLVLLAALERSRAQPHRFLR